MVHGEVSERIIGAAIEVHKALGPGLLESAYEACLCAELVERGVALERQVEMPVHYKGLQIDCGYRLDIVVEGLVVVELKSVQELQPIHQAQLLSYLRLGGYHLGLLLNFNVRQLRQGLVRLVL